MEITNIKIRKVEDKKRVRANVSVTFDHVFVVHDIKVIDGTNGMFVAMPNRLSVEQDTFLDIAHPIKQSFRDYLTEKVLEAYYEVTE